MPSDPIRPCGLHYITLNDQLIPYFKHTILSIIVSSLSSAYTCEAIYSSNACHVKVTRANQNKTVNIGKSLHIRDARPAPPRPQGKWLPRGCPGPENFQLCPAPPRPENYPGARIGANVPTSSKVFGSQKLLTSIFSTKGALRRHVTYNNHPNLT